MNQETPKIKVLIVDDSMFMRQILKDLINADPRMEVVGEARDGVEGVLKNRELDPDVITMDIHMPEMDGRRAVRRIMSKDPTPIVLVSAYTSENAPVTLECLNMGAVDFVQKPSGEVSQDLKTVGAEILEKIVIASKANVYKTERKEPVKKESTQETNKPKQKIVVIGASTGGPPAIEELLKNLNTNLTAPIVIAQHMPEAFIQSFTDRLNKYADVEVKKAVKDEELANGVVYMSPGDCNTIIKTSDGGYSVDCEQGEKVAGHVMPSINRLFESASEVYGAGTMGVVLSGMGDDGLEGSKAIKQNGGTVVAQDEESSLIFGMPQEICKNHLCDAKGAPKQIAQMINQFAG